ncbi:MAG: AMP-binding protein, partial [Pseudomonadota bacterium]
YEPLSPISYLRRAAEIFGPRIAIVHGERRITYSGFYARARQCADALHQAGVGPGDTVAIIAANGPALLEAHYAVPMLGAVLNPINIRLDAASIAFCLTHGEAKVFLVDRDFADAARGAIAQVEQPLQVIDIADAATQKLSGVGDVEYEAFIAQGDPAFDYPGVEDEWASICLLYTSGTTGNPKGGVYSHRGAYLCAMGNALTFQLDHESRYLWTLPMFHCSGWTFTWAVTAVGGTHVCLRAVDTEEIFKRIVEEKVTHMCGAPIVLNMLVHAPDAHKRSFKHQVKVATGGAAPPSAVIASMEALGFDVLHLYGTTESYGPSTLCAPNSAWWDGPEQARHANMARQGIPIAMVEEMMVADPETLAPVPKDGETMGEIMVRGNSIMKGYLKNPEQTNASFSGGWYHSGDLAVWHADSYVEVKDRSKDIIISGGENISSLEVEEVLYRHPDIMEAAVVAKPDATWGETPCAFVDLRPGAPEISGADVIAYCKDNMAGFKAPRYVVFGPLPKTSTGKIQKFVLREQAVDVEAPTAVTAGAA